MEQEKHHDDHDYDDGGGGGRGGRGGKHVDVRKLEWVPFLQR